MRKISFIILISCILCFSFSELNNWDITFIIENQGAKNERIIVKDSFLKIIDEKNSLVYDGSTGEVTYESHRARLWWKGSFDDFVEGFAEAKIINMERFTGSMDSIARSEMKSDFINISNFDSTKTKVDIIKTGKTREIKGYKCNEYKVELDGKTVEVFYHTEEFNPYASLDISSVKKFFNFLNKQKELDYRLSPKYNRFLEKGVILGCRITENKKSIVEQEAIQIENQDIDPTIFLPTDRYRNIFITELVLADIEANFIKE